MDEITYVVCALHGAWPQIAPTLGPDYVYHLFDGVSKHMPRDVNWRFVCFTDRKPSELPGIPTRALPHGMYGWFAKLYVFSPDAFPVGSRVLYFDLDTVVVNDLRALTTVDISLPIFLWDEYHPLPRRAASGIMSFRSGPELYPIWNEFKGYLGKPPPYTSVKKPHPMQNCSYWQQHIRTHCTTDEQWLHQFIYPAEGKHVLWQDILPKQMLMSYKWDILGMNRRHIMRTKQPYTCIYFFHGRPRPHEVKLFWHPRPLSGQTKVSTNECAVAGVAVD